MSLPRYPEYKESGAAWIGDLPASWKTRRVKHVFEIKKRIAGEEGFDILSITQKGIKVKDTESNDGQLSMDYGKYQVVEVGDFAMNHMDLLTGYVDISPFFGVTSPDYRVFSVKDSNLCDAKYFLYLFQNGYVWIRDNVPLSGAPFSRASKYRHRDAVEFHIWRLSTDMRFVGVTLEKSGQKLPRQQNGDWVYWKRVEGRLLEGKLHLSIAAGISDVSAALKALKEHGAYVTHTERLMRAP